jgi:methionine-rich copper-binding protein CopC
MNEIRQMNVGLSESGRYGRWLTAFCLAVALVLMMSLGDRADAHTTVAKVKPSGSASTSIRSVAVTFNGVIRGGSIRVLSSSGRVVSKGRGGRDPRDATRLMVPLRKGLSRGRYTARWKIVAADGHSQSGSFRFRLR